MKALAFVMFIVCVWGLGVCMYKGITQEKKEKEEWGIVSANHYHRALVMSVLSVILFCIFIN